MRSATLVLAAVSLIGAAHCDRDAANDSSDPSERESAPEPDESASASDNPSSDDASERTTHRVGRWKAIDAHTHLSPQSYPIVAEVMREERIYRAVNLSGGHKPDFRTQHLELADRLPDRIALFFNVDWEGVTDPTFGEQTADELAAAVREGYAGLKITKALGLEVKGEDGELLPVDTPKLDPLWERAGELGIPVTIHTGDPKAFFKKPGPDNERWAELKLAEDWSWYGEEYPSRKTLLRARDRLIERHDDTTFILAHMANNPEDMAYVDRLLNRHDNVYVDTSARIAEFGRHPAEDIREFFIDHQNRILFGTDLGVQARRAGDKLRYSLFLGSVRREPPDLDDIPVFFDRHWRYFETDREAVEHPIPIQGDWKVHPIDLPEHVLAKIYWKNAERLIFAPWLGRRAAHRVADVAGEFDRQAE
ncbi:MAG: amidohydrolase family protein [Bradymonadaceae bacterium]